MARHVLLFMVLAFSLQLFPELHAQDSSCGGMAPRQLPLPRNLKSADFAVDTDANLAWVMDGPTLHVLRYSTGEYLRKVELGSFDSSLTTGSTNLPRRLGLAYQYSTAGVASMGGARVAVTSHDEAGIMVLITDAVTGETALQQKVPSAVALQSLAYNRDAHMFYSVSAIAGGFVAVHQIDMEGKATLLFVMEGETVAGKRGEITTVHFSGRQSLLLLCASCNSVVEVSMSGEVIGRRRLPETEMGLMAVSTAESGGPLLVLTKQGQLLVHCFEAEPQNTSLTVNSNDGPGRMTGSAMTRRLAQELPTMEPMFQVVPLVSCKDANRDIQRDVTQEQCATACANDAGCVAYTYNTARQDCFTKSSCEQRENNDDDVTGIKIEEGGTVSDAPIVGDATFQVVPQVACKDESRDIKRGVTREECAAACESDFGCIAYTYNTVRRDCFTKATCDKREDNEDDVTGFKVQMGQTAVDVSTVAEVEFQVVPQVSCKDGNRDVLRDVTQEQCAAACVSDLGCVAYTYNTARRDCFTKSICDERENNEDDVTGIKIELGGMAAQMAADFQVVPQMSCKDDNRDIQRGVTQDECAAACAQDFGCVAYTYNTARRDCFTKATCEEREVNKDDVSGIKKTPAGTVDFDMGTDVARDFQIVPGASCKDETRDRQDGVSLEECAAVCRSDDGCAAFTFNTKSDVCYTKSECEEREPNGDDVTGVRVEGGPGSPPSSTEFEVVVGLSCKDDSLAVYREVSQIACQSLCDVDFRCVTYTYNARQRNCFTKSTCDDREPNDDDVTGFKVGAADPPTPVPGTDGQGGPTLSATYIPLVGVVCNAERVSTFPATQERAGCENLCSHRTSCKAYQYSAFTQECRLNSDCEEKSLVVGAVSFQKPESDADSLRSLRDGLQFDGYDYSVDTSCKDPSLQVFREVHLTECETRCASSLACTAFTFNVRKRDCFLKATCLEVEPNDDDFSGVKRNAVGESYDPVPPSSKYEFMVTNNLSCKDPSIAIFRQVEQATCENACAADPRCTLFTYNRRQGNCFLKAVCKQRSYNDDDVSGVKVERDQQAVGDDGSAVMTTPAPAVGEESDESSSSAYKMFFGIACDDPDVLWLPGIEQPWCESLCTNTPSCLAYTVASSTFDCRLKFSCDDRVFALGAVSGVREAGSSGGNNTPPLPALPPRVFSIIEGVGCKDPHLAIEREVSLEFCRATCAADPSCRAFTWNRTRGDCYLKNTCSDSQLVHDDVSGLAPGIQL